MFRMKLLVAVFLVMAGCFSCALIKPFIDVDETLLLSPRMTKNTVLQYVGTPVEVRAGILLADSNVVEIWLYNVKEKLATVDIHTKPPKNFKASNWMTSQKYALFFLNDHLTKWGYLEDVWPEYEKNGDIVAPNQSGSADNSSTSNGPGGVLGILKHKK